MVLKKHWIMTVCLFVILMSGADLIRVKVITEDANLKETPEIGAKTLAKLPLHTILQVEEKRGEWYKVSLEREGRRVSGYIHEMLVSVIAENEAAPPAKDARPKTAETKEGAAKAKPVKEPPQGLDKAQAEILTDLEIQLEKCRILIREEQRFDEALSLLSPLAARSLRITSREKQLEMTSEIFLMKGLAQAGRGDEAAARAEFRNMFEVDVQIAKTLTKNIYDAKIVTLMKQAEMGYLGVILEYSIEISSVPPGAKVRIDGRDLGLAPVTYKTQSSKALVEVEKEGYKPVREELVLGRKDIKKEYRLEAGVLKLAVRSEPSGARIFYDGQDMGQVTSAELAEVLPGEHLIRLVKDYYADWEMRVIIKSGMPPDPISARLVGVSYAPSRTWGDPESSLFVRPAAIAVDKDRRVLVVDESPAKLKILSAAGEFAVSGGAAGIELKDLVRPAGVAADAQGNIFLTDAESHCVWVLNRSSAVELRWGDFGSGDKEFNTPTGIAIDAAGQLYIVDSGNSRIKKHSAQGGFLKAWGKAGAENGAFLSPWAVAVNAAGEVFVLDSERVQRFSPQGVWLGGWGRQGTGEGEFNNPTGLCLDAAGSIYVADTGNHRIQKFDTQGKIICSWGVKGQERGMLEGPCGIAVDEAGSVYVVEKDNNRVQLFVVGSFALGASKPMTAKMMRQPS